MKKEEINAVLFDLDDTLVNSKKAEYNAICKFKNLYIEFIKLKMLILPKHGAKLQWKLMKDIIVEKYRLKS